MVSLKLLEQYEEIVERRPSEISYIWKSTLMFAYFTSSLSSYACAILFSTSWYDVSGGHCLFWGEVRWIPKDLGATLPNLTLLSVERENSAYDWTREILITHQFGSYCKWFHLICLLSCFAAITFLMMVTICGKGGYGSSLFVAPWRLVVPSLFCNLFMMIVTMTAAQKFSRGYFHLTDSLYRLAYRIMQSKNNPFKYNRRCEVFHVYIEDHNIYGFDTCRINSMIQAAAWVMTWSWIGGFCTLLLRFLTSADFHLAKIKIYEVPEGPERDAVLQNVREGRLSIEKHKEDSHANDLTQKIK